MIRDTSGRKCTWRRPHLRPRVHSRKADAAAIDAIVTRSNGDIRRRKGSGMTSNGFRFLPTSTVYHPVPQATRELVGMPPLVCQPRCVLSIHRPFQVLIATATATVRIGEYGSLHCRDPPNPVSDSLSDPASAIPEGTGEALRMSSFTTLILSESSSLSLLD